MKKIFLAGLMAVALLALIWALMVAGSTAKAAPPPFPAASQASSALLSSVPVTLSINPPTRTIEAGGVFTVNIHVEAGSQQVRGVQLFLDFPVTALRVVDAGGLPTDSIEPILTHLDYAARKEADNDQGHIRYEAVKLGGTAPSGSFDVAMIRFKALTPTAADIAFSTTSPRESRVDSDEGQLTIATEDGQVLINPAIAVTISVDPPISTLKVGEVATVNVQVNASMQQVRGVQIFMDFMTGTLQVVDASGLPTDTIEPILTHLDYAAWKEADNEQGHIRYEAVKLGGTGPSGSFDVAMIRFEALASTAATPLAFSVTPPRETRADSDDGKLAIGTQDGTIVVIGSPYTVTLTAHPTSLTVDETSVLTATVIDQYGYPIPGQDVRFHIMAGSGTITPAIASSDGQGQATAILHSEQVGDVTVRTFVNLDGLSRYDEAVVSFSAGAAAAVSLVANPDGLPVGETSALTATVRDQYSNPVPSQDVVFETDLGSLGSSVVTRTTDAQGIATASLSSIQVGRATVTATAGSAQGTTTVTFTAGTPYTVTLVAAPLSLMVDGTSTLTATVVDEYENPVPDWGLMFFIVSGPGTVTPTVSTTDDLGRVVAALSSEEGGDVTVRGTVDVDGDSKYDQVTVSFYRYELFLPLINKSYTTQ